MTQFSHPSLYPSTSLPLQAWILCVLVLTQYPNLACPMSRVEAAPVEAFTVNTLSKCRCEQEKLTLSQSRQNWLLKLYGPMVRKLCSDLGTRQQAQMILPVAGSSINTGPVTRTPSGPKAYCTLPVIWFSSISQRVVKSRCFETRVEKNLTWWRVLYLSSTCILVRGYWDMAYQNYCVTTWIHAVISFSLHSRKVRSCRNHILVTFPIDLGPLEFFC